MELLISSLTEAMELMESLICDTCRLLISFSSHTFVILLAIEDSERMVLPELWTLFLEACFMFSTKVPMSFVSFCVSSASSLISPATTAKPFPASPALAASTEAFSARRFVWREIVSMPERRELIWLIRSISSSMSDCISFEAASVSAERSLMEVSSFCPSSIFLYTSSVSSEIWIIVLVSSS